MKERPMRRFSFRLARMCGRLDVDKLMDEIPATLFNEWWGFCSLEPEPARKITDYLVKLMSVIAAGFGMKLSSDDLVIRYGESDDERMLRKMMAFNHRMAAQSPKNRN